MNNRSELAGLVKPYLGRSVRREIAGTAQANAANEAAITLDQAVLPKTRTRDTIREAIQSRGWMITDTEESWDVAVPVGADRRQIVSIQFERHDESGRLLVVYSSRCGPATNKNAMLLLRRNARMFQTAFVVEKRDDVTWVVLRGVQRSIGAESAEAVRMIETIARHADSVERKLMGTDEF